MKILKTSLKSDFKFRVKRSERDVIEDLVHPVQTKSSNSFE
jgi:hypothetical protein